MGAFVPCGENPAMLYAPKLAAACDPGNGRTQLAETAGGLSLFEDKRPELELQIDNLTVLTAKEEKHCRLKRNS